MLTTIFDEFRSIYKKKKNYGISYAFPLINAALPHHFAAVLSAYNFRVNSISIGKLEEERKRKRGKQETAINVVNFINTSAMRSAYFV